MYVNVSVDVDPVEVIEELINDSNKEDVRAVMVDVIYSFIDAEDEEFGLALIEAIDDMPEWVTKHTRQILKECFGGEDA